MTTRRDFAASAGGLGLGAALSAVAGFRSRTPVVQDAGTVDWVNMKAAGARGDGRTDDTDVIERVFAEKSGGVVYFPGGAYVISRTIRVPYPVSIIGDGGRATYLHSRITDGSPVLDIGHADYSHRLRGVQIGALTLRGEGEARTRSGGLRVHALYDSLLQSLRIERLGWGIECDRAISVQFDNLVVTGMRDDGGLSGEGIYLYGQCNGCLFNNLRSTDHSGPALRLGYGQNLTLVSPVIEGVQTAAIVIGQEQGGRFIECRGVTVLNPYFELNRAHDMQFLRGTPPTIIGGYWGPTREDYVAPIASLVPFTAIGCAFPPAPGGAFRVTEKAASSLFLGCTFGGEVATYSRPEFRHTARLRVLGADGDRVVGGDESGE